MSSSEPPQIHLGFCDDEILQLMINLGIRPQKAQTLLALAKEDVLTELMDKIRENTSVNPVTEQFPTCRLLLSFLNKRLQK